MAIKFTIKGDPRPKLRDVIEWKPAPHIMPNPEMVKYRNEVRSAFNALFSGTYTKPLILEVQFFRSDHHRVSLGGMVDNIVAALSPEVIQHPSLVKKIEASLDVDENNPRTVIILRPIVKEATQATIKSGDPSPT